MSKGCSFLEIKKHNLSKYKTKLILTSGDASSKRIASEPLWTRTNRSVVNGSTCGDKTTGPGTGVGTALVLTSQVRRALCADGALGPTVGRAADVVEQA